MYMYIHTYLEVYATHSSGTQITHTHTQSYTCKQGRLLPGTGRAERLLQLCTCALGLAGRSESGRGDGGRWVGERECGKSKPEGGRPRAGVCVCSGLQLFRRHTKSARTSLEIEMKWRARAREREGRGREIEGVRRQGGSVHCTCYQTHGQSKNHIHIHVVMMCIPKMHTWDKSNHRPTYMYIHMHLHLRTNTCIIKIYMERICTCICTHKCVCVRVCALSL